MTTTTSVITILAVCTFYGDEHAGQLTASGSIFDPEGFSAASWLYPLGTEITVTHGDKSVIVVIDDRCDHLTELDLSKRAFESICPLEFGRVTVKVEFDASRQTQDWISKYGDGEVDLLP